MDEHTAHRPFLFRALTAALLTLGLGLAAGPAPASAETGDRSPPTSDEGVPPTPEGEYTPWHEETPQVPRFSPTSSPSPTDDCACDEWSMSGEALWNTVVIIYLIGGLLFLFIQMAKNAGSGGHGGRGGSPGGDGGGGGGGGVADGGGGGGGC